MNDIPDVLDELADKDDDEIENELLLLWRKKLFTV
jgi:hypothetical protein